jgi:hypothetical protein
MTEVSYDGVGLPESDYPDAADVEVDLSVKGDDEDVVEKVAMHARNEAVRALQAFESETPPSECDGTGVGVAWGRIFESEGDE